MKAIFINPKVGDKVVLIRNGVESQQRIVEVTPKAIRVSSCNLFRFNRTGKLNKKIDHNGLLVAEIKPLGCDE